MKLTKENEKILLKLGFRPDAKKEWWTLDCGWTFEIHYIRNFKHLIHRMKKTWIDYGKNAKISLNKPISQ